MDEVIDNSLLNSDKLVEAGYSFLFGFGKKDVDDPFSNVSPSGPSSDSNVDCSGLRALIVDDNVLNTKVAIKAVEKYHFTVDSASSGKECITKVQNTNYDIIFMDYMMPEMDGIETLQELKKLGISLPPVVVLTANVIAGMREKYLSSGFDEFLAKPLNPKDLERVVNLFFKK